MDFTVLRFVQSSTHWSLLVSSLEFKALLHLTLNTHLFLSLFSQSGQLNKVTVIDATTGVTGKQFNKKVNLLKFILIATHHLMSHLLLSGRYSQSMGRRGTPQKSAGQTEGGIFMVCGVLCLILWSFVTICVRWFRWFWWLEVDYYWSCVCIGLISLSIISIFSILTTRPKPSWTRCPRWMAARECTAQRRRRK